MDGAIEAIASVRAGFFFAFVGMIAQMTHIWLLAYQYSSFEGTGAIIQAWILSTALGGGLLFFTVRAGNPERNNNNVTIARERYNKTANAFAVFEAFINLYYWANKIVFIPGFSNGTFDPVAVQWHQLFIAVPFAIAIPVVLKQYAGEIRLKEKETGENTQKTNDNTIKELRNEIGRIDNRINSLAGDVIDLLNTVEESEKRLKKQIETIVPNKADFRGMQQASGSTPDASNISKVHAKKATKTNQSPTEIAQPLSEEEQKSKNK